MQLVFRVFRMRIQSLTGDHRLINTLQIDCDTFFSICMLHLSETLGKIQIRECSDSEAIRELQKRFTREIFVWGFRLHSKVCTELLSTAFGDVELENELHKYRAQRLWTRISPKTSLYCKKKATVWLISHVVGYLSRLWTAQIVAISVLLKVGYNTSLL